MKITKATLKSFVKNNWDKLYIRVKSDFDGMQDCVVSVNDTFRPIDYKNEWAIGNMEHTLGIQGLWLVGFSRDYFNEYNKDGFKGIEVYNSCGSTILAVKNNL